MVLVEEERQREEAAVTIEISCRKEVKWATNAALLYSCTVASFSPLLS